jgi:hypothetical protein
MCEVTKSLIGKVCYKISMLKWGGMIFSNKPYRTIVYMKLVMMKG